MAVKYLTISSLLQQNISQRNVSQNENPKPQL